MAFRIGSNISKKRRTLLIRTYLPDWIITILLFGLFYLLDKVEGFRREFSLTDTSIQHTYALHERITVTALGFIGALAPAVIILLISLFYARSWFDLNAGWLGLLLSLAVTSTSTNIIKICVGRPRPDLLDRCQPRAGAVNAGPPSYGLATSDICTRTDLLRDGFRSFPSGHSSWVWAAMWFLTLYLAGKMQIHNAKGFSIKTWILLIPLAAAALVTISRTMDYRHHATDVIAGSLLGVIVSWYCYRQYFPELSHPHCDKAYSPRIPRELDDEENITSSELTSTAHPDRSDMTSEGDQRRRPGREASDASVGEPIIVNGKVPSEEVHLRS